jgi:hypothetical protein
MPESEAIVFASGLKKSFALVKKGKFVFWVYIISTAFASLHRYLIGKINNYLIFKTSFFNLIAGRDLYLPYPELYFDYYKYSPAFALLIAPFAILPNALGLVAWNLLNAGALFFSINKLDFTERQKTLICWIILVELLTSIQNAQSNALIAAFILLAFFCFENKNVFVAALLIALAAYIKIFGIAAVVLAVFYPKKLQFALSMFFWLLLFAALPLIVMDIAQLAALYESWFNLLKQDYVARGLSVMDVLKSSFGLEFPKIAVQILGAALLGLPLLNFRAHQERAFRYLFLCSLLIAIIIFNHKAESPTYIIAMTGVAMWYAAQKAAKVDVALLALAVIFTSLSPTDIFPKILRETLVIPFVLKAWPCILIWLKIEYQLLFGKIENQTLAFAGR